jgi:hypothetical protein
MAHFLKWLCVPLIFTAVLFVVLYLWWNYGPPTPVSPALAAKGVGSSGWVASRALISGIPALIVTVLAVVVLPRISWWPVLYIGVGAVAAHWWLSTLWYWFSGSTQTTNGADVIRAAISQACVLLVSAICLRGRRSSGAL